MKSSDTVQVFFEDVRVPKSYIIGEEGQGFTYQMLQFQEERLWGTAAGMVDNIVDLLSTRCVDSWGTPFVVAWFWFSCCLGWMVLMAGAPVNLAQVGLLQARWSSLGDNNNNNNSNNNNRIERHNLKLLQPPHCAANCLQHVCSSGLGAIMCKSCATHRTLITCNLQCATWYEGTAQLLSLTELKWHLF